MITKTTMRIKDLILASLVALMAIVSCETEENLGMPSIKLDGNGTMTFEVAGGDQQIALTATRDWMAETDADWVMVSPASGKASAESQTVTVTALENKGLDRTAEIKFTIGMSFQTLTVTQSGPGGSAENLVVYANDFDKEEAGKTYGSGSSYPYLDQFNGWMNAWGTGASTVTYNYKGMSTRSNSTSDSNYSDYEGSGTNNLFFGSSAYFATKNITLGGATDFTLSFGTEKYDGNNKEALFDPAEFHVYLSSDNAKWVEIEYTYAGTAAGRWNLATADFSVPAGTEKLSITVKADAASVYRIDDMKLVISDGGAAVDFAQGADMSFNDGPASGGDEGGSESDGDAIYSNNFDKAAATKTYGSGESWPYLEEFEGWVNHAGTGAANVTYAYSGVSARNNSNSDGSYSDYEGSGMNNLFFGSDAYFAVKGIALGGTTDLTLTFGTEKYSSSAGSVFTNSEYHIWLSNDGGQKWVEFTDYTFAGGTTDGRWNVATANITVPAGTESLSICMQVDVASAYRLDDYKLVASATPGTSVDFTAAVEKEFTAGGEEGGGEGGVTPPSGDATLMTIAEVLQAGSSALPDGAYIEAVVISDRALNNLTSKKGLYVQDETAGLQFYLAVNHELDFGDKVKVDLSGVKLADYNGAVQVSGLALDKISTISTGNSVTAKTVSIDDFLANKYEGQYVAIEGVQVVEADLARTFVEGEAHTSINVETADGKTFAIFSSKYATYGTETVPQGSGTIKGISSISKGAMQVIFAQASDYAGLTGERFDGNSGGEVTPPAGGDDEGTPESPKKVTIAEFLAAPVSSDFWYELTGEIISIAKEDYGNFTIKDSTGEVYIYGMTNGWVGSNDKSFSQIGLKVGDTVTLGTLRGEYNGTPQGGGNKVPAFYISHVPGTGGDNGGNGEGGEVTPPTGEGDAVLTFPDGNSKSVSSYTDTWTAVSGGYTWTISNFNNNNNGWAYIKCGRKSDPSVASISVGVAAKVSEVIVTVDNCLDVTKVNSAKLIVASDADFANIVETVSGSAAKGDQSFAVSTPAEGMYYKVEYDCSAHGSKNGIIQISKVTCVTVK